MKQIVPFKKDLLFKTKVSEITSISLEREIDTSEEGVITGVFHITGDYKMNEGSINRDDFSFDLPFDISLDPRYDMSSVKADIEDFYYDIINNDTLKVNIDLFIEAEYLEEEPVMEEQVVEEPVREEVTQKVREEVTQEVREEREEEKMDTIDIKKDIYEENDTIKDNVKDVVSDEVREEDNITASDLFSNLDDTETYTTYYVYIVKEEDTIDKILVKYGISKDELESYNDITNIKPGDKVIIPKTYEQ